MYERWRQSSRECLKGASSCNDFFQIDKFENQNFPIKVPLEFANLINKDDPQDPLLRQVINLTPNAKIGFNDTPFEDEKYSPVEGLIHKYSSRVLLITSRVCAIHCQYCFRQNFDYEGHDAVSNWNSIRQYIKDNTQINEVILSGGDPLSLSDEKIKWLVHEIEKISHIDTIRIHTRAGVVIPSRITNHLADNLNNSTLNVVLVFHINHANELTNEFKKSLTKLRKLTLLNQSVLLKGVNDNKESLVDLSIKLFSYGILPYYLHLLDKVSGSEHFLVSDDYAIKLHSYMKQTLSGYLVPRLVRDENGEFKSWV